MSPDPDKEPGRLNGWKEIAAYLGKGSRTVQRWEKLYGLPVHRIGREGGEIVFAFRDEIDRWTRSDARERAASGDLAATARDGDATDPGPGAIEGRRPAPGRKQPGWLVVLGLIVLVAGTSFLSSWLLHRTPAARVASSRVPRGWRLENERLVVFDERGGTLFEHDFGFGLNRAVPSADSDAWTASPVRIADIDGDGRLEVLAMPVAVARENRRLYCFEADGRLRFVHQPTGQARFGDREYAEPWLAHRVIVTERPGGARSLFAVFIHNLWFPSRLQELDARGEVRREYWSSGYVETVVEAVWRGRPVLLVGAANNELKGASLALFDREALGGRSPASKPEYLCRSCPEGGPREMVVFPTLCLFARKGGIAGLYEAWVEGDDRLVVQVTQAVESLDGVGPAGQTVVHYTLDRDLVPVHAEISTEFVTVHRRLERQGLLDHPFGPRDEAAMLPVRRWDGTRFKDVAPGKVSR